MDHQDFKKKSVLVIDDFANVRKSIKSMLSTIGFVNVYEAHNASSATRIAKDAHIDLVLSDFNLGSGRDGARLLEEWRQFETISLQTIFVLITAETSREMVVSAMEYKPDDYLAKPFTQEVLRSRLDRWFERRSVLLPLFNLVVEKDWSAATPVAKQLMEAHPRYRAEVQGYFVESLIQTNQLTQAESFLEGILANRFQAWAQAALHRVQVKQNKIAEAEAGFKKVLLRDPNQMDVYDALADVLEKQGKESERQVVLDKAVARAPYNIERQKTLIESAQRNMDFKRASVGYRDIISLSTGSMHESVSNFQGYISNLQDDLRYTTDESRKREIQKELASVNRKMKEQYPSDVNATLYSKALIIHNSETPASPEHTKVLDNIHSTLLAEIAEVSPETALFGTQAFYMAQKFDEADELVDRFKVQFKHSPEICKKLDELQAEPISGADKAKASKLNLKGIELYKQGEYSESIHYFAQALELSSRHPGIILNIVQSQLSLNQQQGLNGKTLDECESYLERLSYLSEDHYQYDRLTKIKKKVAEYR